MCQFGGILGWAERDSHFILQWRLFFLLDFKLTILLHFLLHFLLDFKLTIEIQLALVIRHERGRVCPAGAKRTTT